MVIDLAEHRLNRQLRSASAVPTMPGPSKPVPLSTALVLMWRKITPSTWLMVDPRTGVRAVIRHAGSEAGRNLWSVLPAATLQPVSEGRTDDIVEAKLMAEMVLRAYADTMGGEAPNA